MHEGIKQKIADKIISRPVIKKAGVYKHNYDGNEPLEWPGENIPNLYPDAGAETDTEELEITNPEADTEELEIENGKGIISKVLGKLATGLQNSGDSYEDLADVRRNIPGALHQIKGVDANLPPNASPRDYKRFERIRRKDIKKSKRIHDITKAKHDLVDKSHSSKGLRSGKIIRDNITDQRTKIGLEEYFDEHNNESGSTRYGFAHLKDGRKVPIKYTEPYREPPLSFPKNEADDHLPPEEQERITAENKRIAEDNSRRIKTAERLQNERLQAEVEKIEEGAPIDARKPIDLTDPPLKQAELSALTDEEISSMMKLGVLTREDAKKIDEKRLFDRMKELEKPTPKTDLDEPTKAIERINENTPNWGGNRATEAKQLKKWLILHREATGIRKEQETIASGTDKIAKKLRRSAGRRVNASSRVVGIQKKKVEFKNRATERYARASDPFRGRSARDIHIRTAAEKVRRKSYEEDKNARIKDRYNRRKGYIEKILESQQELRADFSKKLNSDQKQYFNKQVKEAYEKAVENFKASNNRTPYQNENARLLLQSTKAIVRSLKHRGIGKA